MRQAVIDSGGLFAVWPSIQKVPDDIVRELGDKDTKVIAGLVIDGPQQQIQAAWEVVRYARLRGVSLEQSWAAFAVVAMGLDVNRTIANVAEVGPGHMLAFLLMVLDHARRLKPCVN
jgi:hypothetical protein